MRASFLHIMMAAWLSVGMPMAAHADDATAAEQGSERQAVSMGQRLAMQIYPRERFLDQAVDAFNQGMEVSFRADPMMLVFTSRDTEFLPFLLAEMNSGIRNLFDGGYPEYAAMLGELFTERMTDDEISHALEFFSSPAGNTFVVMSVNSMQLNPDAFLNKSGADAPLTAPDWALLDEATLGAELSQLPEEDLRAVMMFSLSPAARKIGKIGPDIAQLSLDFGTRLATDNETELHSLIENAIAKYFERQEA